MLFFILTLVLIFVAYKWSISTFDYFRKQGIAFRKPVPLVGTQDGLFSKKALVDLLAEIYNEFRNEKVSGLFEFRRPTALIRDPKIIKQLTVKDFDYFMDHRTIVTEENDPLFGNTVISMRGQKWKDMRGTLSPAFTGSKMRLMMDFVSQVGLQTAETMRKDIENGGQNKFEFKALASKFTLDIIASTAFGIEVNSFKNPNNEFLQVANKIMNFTGWKTTLKFAGYLAFPKIMSHLKVHILDKENCDFFEKAIYETIRTREKLGIVRHDMLNLLMEAKKGKLTHNNKHEENIVDGFATVEESHVGKAEVKRNWTDIELAAQCFIFFLGGFESVSQTMSFLGYELACNPDIQQKLFNEIQEMDSKIDGKINYEQIQSMKYLDQVVSETLRKWPITPATDRICVKEYDLHFDNKTLNFQPGVNIFIPIWSLHRDPKYFPNPTKFDPDRFSDENKSKIDLDTYAPFGFGPRNCIGSRFALMEIKTIFYYLLLNFSIEVTDKTQIPLEFEKTPIAIRPANGIWLELKPRN